MPNEKDAEIKSRYEDYSVEELRAALDAIFDSTDEFSDSDVEKMDEIMAVLDKKDPLPQRYTAEESLKNFQENYREELSRLGIRNTEEVIEKEPEEIDAPINAAVVMPRVCCAGKASAEYANAEAKQSNCCRKLFHTALIAAAVVALMVIITVSAAAAGIDIWGWVPVWNGRTFRFVAEESESVTSLDIPEAVKQLGIEEPLFPTWIPEGFEVAEQQIILGEPTVLLATYVFRDRVISIVIRPCDDDSSLLVEMDDGNPLEYVVHDTVHYIFSNSGQSVSIWIAQGFSVNIHGDVTTSEMKHIIDSIYD